MAIVHYRMARVFTQCFLGFNFAAYLGWVLATIDGRGAMESGSRPNALEEGLNPSASPEGDGPPRFIWLPQMLGQPRHSRYLVDRLTTRLKGASFSTALDHSRIPLLWSWIAHTRATRRTSLHWIWDSPPSFRRSHHGYAYGSMTENSTSGAMKSSDCFVG